MMYVGLQIASAVTTVTYAAARSVAGRAGGVQVAQELGGALRSSVVQASSGKGYLERITVSRESTSTLAKSLLDFPSQLAIKPLL